MEKAKIDSPRGAFTLGKSHNPVQDIYLRKVEGKENKVVGVAVKGLADPGRGCSCSARGMQRRRKQPPCRRSRAAAARLCGVRSALVTPVHAPWTSPPSSSSA